MDKSDPTDVEKVALIFRNLGADAGQSQTMAGQLLKRAGQIADERDISKVEALETLLKQVVEARQGSE
jgi:hypothetical protein